MAACSARAILLRDCQRLVNNDRNVFAACMVATGPCRRHGHRRHPQLVHGLRGRAQSARRQTSAARHRRVAWRSIRGRAVLVADVSVHDMPDGDAAGRHRRGSRARWRRRLAIEPRVALLAYSTFGHPRGERSDRVREAVAILDKRQVDFEYDGDMAADVALNREALRQYPFCRLSDTANVLVMPAFHSGLHLHQDAEGAGRRHADRADAGGPDALGADLPARAPRTATSSTWPRWPPTT